MVSLSAEGQSEDIITCLTKRSSGFFSALELNNRRSIDGRDAIEPGTSQPGLLVMLQSLSH